MNLTETAKLLTMCAAFDQRTIGEADVAAWQATLDDLRFEDCREAVIAHFRNSASRIMPHDVRVAVNAMRRERLERDVEAYIPDADPNDPAAYIEAMKARRTRIADGTERQRPVAELIAGVERNLGRPA